MTSGSDFSANKNNDWAEFRIARTALGVSGGQDVKVLFIFRPAENKVGASDSTPFDGASGAANDYGNLGSNFTQYATYKMPGGDETPPAAVTGISATQGTNTGEISLTWTMPGDDGWSGNISGGKFRITYTTNTAAVFQSASYNVERSTSGNVNSSQGYLISGLSGGDTYYIRLWTADDVSNFSSLSSGVTTFANRLLPLRRLSPQQWTAQRTARGAVSRMSSPPVSKIPTTARDVYVTNDANNLYIGFQFNGDPWGSSVNNDLLAHYVFLIDTGTTGGTSQDPWKYTTSVSWNKKPDIAVAGSHNKNSSANSFNAMTRYVSDEFVEEYNDHGVGFGLFIIHHE